MMITERTIANQESTKNEKIFLTPFEKITKMLLHNYLQSLSLENANNITKLLENVSEKEIQVEDIGKCFEHSLNPDERKQKGQYYTPKTIVRYMIKSLGIKESSKTLDPTCGCGSFTLGLHDYLSEKYGKTSLKNIFGVDLNPIAVDITRLCLSLKSDNAKSHSNLLKKNIQVGNSITKNDIFEWDVNFKPIMNEGGFDFVIGNPPYGMIGKSEITFDDSNYQEIVQGTINIASLLIVQSLSLLKHNGRMAFLLPKSILHVKSYKNLRKYILDKSCVLQIYNLGQEFSDVRGEQIILFLQKTKRKSKTVKISTGIHEVDSNTIKPKKAFQADYSLLSPEKFLVFDDMEYSRILDKLNNMRNTVRLTEYVDGDIFRGITLNPIQQIKISEKPLKNSVKILRGRSISKYKISKPYYVKKTELKKQNLSKKICALDNKQKIVLQNIFSSESGMISSFDTDGVLTSDTVTNVIINDKNTGKYLLGLFNSKLINFYLMFGVFNRSKLTMHTDKKYLGEIPIINKPDPKILKKIIALVDSATKKESEETKKVTRIIDTHVFKLYGISKKDSQIITNAVDGVLSKKSKW